MAWQRKIPFGYTMKKGELQCNPTESAAVKEIFRLYADGMAYSKIAAEMMRRGLRYHSHTAEWNKHMVKRILENERYLGEKEYPPILEPEAFLRAQLVRGEKNTFTPCPDYIGPIREKAVCGVCGGRMLRDTRAGGKPRWYCEKEGCTNRRYIEDEDIRTALSERLDVLAQTLNLLDWLLPQNTEEPTLEAVRIRNEVIRELNKAEPGAEYTKMLILACAAEQYSGISDATPYYQMRSLRNKIGRQPMSDALHGEIFKTAVQEVHFTADGGLHLGLIQLIGRKSLKRVDHSILVLGAFYLLVIAAYVFFEFHIVNYRPILIENVLEASYPSSTTMLVLCVMPTAIMQFDRLVKGKKARIMVNTVSVIFTAIAIVGRFLSGVHWFTDIVGGALLSSALVMLYYSVHLIIESKQLR